MVIIYALYSVENLESQTGSYFCSLEADKKKKGKITSEDSSQKKQKRDFFPVSIPHPMEDNSPPYRNSRNGQA